MLRTYEETWKRCLDLDMKAQHEAICSSLNTSINLVQCQLKHSQDFEENLTNDTEVLLEEQTFYPKRNKVDKDKWSHICRI